MQVFNRFVLSLSVLSLFFTHPIHAKTNPEKNVYVADYVIVGVGTAGAVLANKLSADKKTSVLALSNGPNLSDKTYIKFSANAAYTVLSGLLEGAIPPDAESIDFPPSIQDPLNYIDTVISTLGPSLYETGFSIPQPDANNRELLWVMALPEGGASSINAGAWCRGTNQLFSQWEAIAGPEWSVHRILKTYKQLENYHGRTLNPDSRGNHGPLDIRQSNPTNLSSKFSQAVIAATGFPYVLDYNDPNTPIGVSPQVQLTQNGEGGKYRVSSATAFLNEKVMTPTGFGLDGRKLRVLFNSFGTKTIWNGTKAVGVEFIQDGIVKTAYASKGVIVCAGLRSSTFLMHSGVGPQSLLQSLSIPVIYDNPNVGQNLADQPHIVTLFTSNPNDTILGSTSLFSQISWLPAPGEDPTIRKVRLATVNIIPGITLALLDLCQPFSRGSITINSSNPLAPPVIDNGELTDSRDLDLYKAAFKIYMKDINIALQAIDPEYQLLFPDPGVLDNDTLLTDFIKEEIGSNMHFQSHCRMAPLDQGGVVDSTGHVYGVQNLIVADDSVVPQGMDGSPMASAYLIAANIARLLGY